MTDNLRQRRRPDGLESKRPSNGLVDDIGPFDPFTSVIESDAAMSADVDNIDTLQAPVDTSVSARSPKGQFLPGNKGGPGRGNIKLSPRASAPAARREGGDLLDEVKAALEQYGTERFITSLMHKSPSTAAQLIMSLNKLAEQGIVQPPAPPVVEISCPFPLPGAAASDFDAYTVQSLHEENAALRRRLDKQAATPKAPAQPEPDPPGWTCQVCKRLAGVERVVPQGTPACPSCGSFSDGTSPRAGAGIPPASAVVTVDDQPAAGWQQHNNIQGALDAHRADAPAGGLDGPDAWIDAEVAARDADFRSRWGLR